MSFAGFPAAAFKFYAGLRADNSKTYWTAHRAVYEDSVRKPPSPRLAGESAGDLVRSDWDRLRPLIDWITTYCPAARDNRRAGGAQ